LDRSLAFYVGLLGFRILYARPDERFAFLDRDGAEIMLEQSMDQLHSVLLAAGNEFFLPLEERWYRRDDSKLGVRQFAVQDPDGYLIRLSQVIGTRPVRR
jgi:catechol 2,3-dioxygenase-like lactoylglutathione lyase family enzyme